MLLCIAADQRQADIILNFVNEDFRSSPVLRQLILRRTQRALRLKNNVDIEVRAADYRRLRGPTYIAVICDELAFWMSDGTTRTVKFSPPCVRAWERRRVRCF